MLTSLVDAGAGQLRHSPAFAELKVLLPGAPVLGTGLESILLTRRSAEVQPSGRAWVTPAIKRPPKVTRSSARCVERSLSPSFRPAHH
ncbi:Uncharacterised protein [Mycobacteroides abscessus subsp. abscessus]|nr:Uncharacterised protein [Mycobacteroides abscessus subsp. abscessus]